MSNSDERDFWLSSLDDLDEELAAGDLSPQDHEVLTRTYTRQAAQALRSHEPGTDELASNELDEAAEQSDQAMSQSHRQRRRKRRKQAVLLGGLVAVGVVGGLLLANAVGSRYSGDTITGNDAVFSVPGLLRNAEESAAAGNLSEAIAIYDQVLERSPTQPTALAYKGWLLSLQGSDAAATDILADAVAAAPNYPDARAFSSIVLFRSGDCEGAAQELAAFDATEPPDFLAELLAAQGLRTNVARCRILAEADSGFIALADLGLGASDAVAGATSLYNPTSPTAGQPVLALRVYEAVLAETGNHPDALTYSGVILTQTGLSAQAEEGARRIDQAVEVAPNHAEARLWRAWLFIGLGETAQATADLEHLDTLNPSSEIARLASDLRSLL